MRVPLDGWFVMLECASPSPPLMRQSRQQRASPPKTSGVPSAEFIKFKLKGTSDPYVKVHVHLAASNPLWLGSKYDAKYKVF